jgi:hypothetical protein
MRFSQAVDLYIDDQRAEGRINSRHTEREYRGTLDRHGDDVQNRDPGYTNRDDVKRTLGRWRHPNTRAKNRAILVSFYDWLVEEGHRPSTRRGRRNVRGDAPRRATGSPTARQCGCSTPSAANVNAGSSS